MLGTRRASVSVACSVLRKARLIKHSRRQIIIVDRKGLEEASCECYKAIQTQLAGWRDGSRKMASCANTNIRYHGDDMPGVNDGSGPTEEKILVLNSGSSSQKICLYE